MITLNNILVATDFGEASEAALRYGRELAKRFDATLHVLTVAENLAIATFGAETFAAVAPRLQNEIEAAARQALNEAVIDSDHSGPATRPVVLTSSSPATAIVDYAQEHDINLIVMGTNGRGVLEHFLMGSVAERVVRLAPCPVLTVRARERDFVRPDTLIQARAGART
jgi:nucleotide-binding universal stress UspA family protein